MGNAEVNGGRPAEQRAVRTTIVGGRPPGAGKPVGNIPRGIEVLVKKAAVDPAFRRLLLAKRAEAAKTIGLDLSPSEAAMLAAIPGAQLEAIISNTKVDPKLRPILMGAAAAVMLVVLGADMVGCDGNGGTKGGRPDRPPSQQQPAVSNPTATNPANTTRPQDKPSPARGKVTHEAKLAEVKEKVKRISLGMKRSEVEVLFPEKDGGIQGPSVSRYYEHPEVMIEIPFDRTGGNWSKNNRVTGPPKIYRSLRHID